MMQIRIRLRGGDAASALEAIPAAMVRMFDRIYALIQTTTDITTSVPAGVAGARTGGRSSDIG